jgi:hypothetical protein
LSLLACVVVTLALSGVATAGAKQVDNSSTLKANRAYETFLRSLVAQGPAWQTKANAFVASVTTNCPSVLAAVNMLPITAANGGSLRAFGQEMGTDVAASIDGADVASFERLAHTLTRLHWSGRRSRSAITRFITAGRGLLNLPPSDICTDARALAADSAVGTPPGTFTWLSTFARVSSTQHSALDGFLRVLERFDTPADRRIVNGINNLAVVVTSAQDSFLTGEVPKLGAALGLTR